ncbi:MAG TPA: hypothetical protein PL009_08985 [Flavipsychrobacter sp.]|nr:hypothetical protein [Flavipsychrobacter sp.]
MKKHIFPALLIGAIMTVAPSQSDAQIRNDRGTFNMPGKGDVLVETQARINLGGGSLFDLNDGFLWNLNNGLDIGANNFSSSNYFPMLKVRKFTSDNTALRFLLNISYNSQRVDGPVVDTNLNNFGIGVGMGFEKIFKPAERLNTYIGADVMLGYARMGAKIDGPVDNNIDQGAFGFGLRGFTGMDYYFLPKVYAGIELGWGLSYNRYGVVNFTNGDNNRTSSEFTLTPYVTPVFRLGYVLGATKKMRGNGEPTYRSNDGGDDE